MSKVKGACVFRYDGDGCLSSKYVNENSAPFGETCKLIGDPNPNDNFEGVYDTVWIENTKYSPVKAKLTISRNSNGSYSLRWTGANFAGVGMLYGGLLTCGYWSF